MTQYVNAPNLMTSTGLALGVLAVLLASEGRLGAAAAAVGLAATLDALDGVVARRLNVEGRFGSNLDSLTDLTAFGVAPALMLHQGPLDGLPVAGAVACVVFVLAGAWRLARFPLVENRRFWLGLPIPPAGLAVATASAVGIAAMPAIGLAIAAAALMVSGLRFSTAAAVRDGVRGRRVARAPQPAGAEADGQDERDRAAALALVSE